MKQFIKRAVLSVAGLSAVVVLASPLSASATALSVTATRGADPVTGLNTKVTETVTTNQATTAADTLVQVTFSAFSGGSVNCDDTLNRWPVYYKNGRPVGAVPASAIVQWDCSAAGTTLGVDVTGWGAGYTVRYVTVFDSTSPSVNSLTTTASFTTSANGVQTAYATSGPKRA